MIRKNIFVELTKNTTQQLLLIISQILAVIAILLSFGVFYNNEYKMQEGEFLETSFGVYFSSEAGDNLNEVAKSAVKASEIKKAVPVILMSVSDISAGSILYSESKIDDSIKEIFKEQYSEREYLTWLSTIDYKEGKQVFSVVDDNSKLGIDHYFSLEAMREGKKVCIVNSYLNSYSSGYFNIGEEKYTIVGTESQGAISMNTDGMIPFLAITDELIPTSLYINFVRPITGIEFKELVEKFTKAFGNRVSFSEKKVIAIDDKATFVSSMLMAVFVAFISAYCVGLIVSYMLKRRIGMTAIYRICGASARRACSMYFAELVILLLTTGAIGYFTYIKLIMPKLAKYFEYFTLIYKANRHITIIVVYEIVIMLASLVVIISANVRSPKELLRRAWE